MRAAVVATAFVATALAVGLISPEARASAAVPADGPAFGVQHFVLKYSIDHPQLPPLQHILMSEVELGKVADGWVAPRDGVPSFVFPIQRIPDDHPQRFYASALRAIGAAIVEEFNSRDLLGIYVSPDPSQIDPSSLRDLRDPQSSVLLLKISIATIREVRTVASGERVSSEDRINSPLHAQRIRERSPLQPRPTVGDSPTDLVRADLLDEYVYRLNRHPSRRVDVALSASDHPGGVALDYLVTERRPWMAFAQTSTTGTRDTTRWRQWFGASHYQLTNRDDILSLNYITGNFSDLSTAWGTYDTPLLGSERLRLRFDGLWSEYDADDVGLAKVDFDGTTVQGGGRLTYNVFQDRDLFVDLLAGARYQRLETENRFMITEGKTNFVLPHAGLYVEQIGDTASLRGSTVLEANLPGLGTDDDELVFLGRIDPDDDWWVMRWDMLFAFYLEPLLNKAAWLDPSTPDSSTLAHEVSLRFSGQEAFGYRLIPQHQMVVGGLYTVRGYPESFIAGDDVLVGRAEYTYHLPRSFSVRREPARMPILGDFRIAPQYPYGRPDWDLAVSLFSDIACVRQTESLSFERERTIIGTGIGAEVTIKQYLKLRLDWGFALRDADGDPDVDSGDQELTFLATFQY